MLNLFLLTFAAGAITGALVNLARKWLSAGEDGQVKKIYAGLQKYWPARLDRDLLLNILLFLILFGMGIKLGAGKLYEQYQEIGLQSVVMTVTTAAGSLLFVIAGRKVWQKREKERLS